MISLCCCCLTAPDGYCLIDEVPSLMSENRHQPSSQSFFCFLLEISIRDQVRPCPQSADLLHLKTVVNPTTFFLTVFLLLLIVGVNISSTKKEKEIFIVSQRKRAFEDFHTLSPF